MYEHEELVLTDIFYMQWQTPVRYKDYIKSDLVFQQFRMTFKKNLRCILDAPKLPMPDSIKTLIHIFA